MRKIKMAVTLLSAAVVLTMCLCSCTPLVLTQVGDPTQSALSFFEAYCSGDSEAVSKLTSNYDSVELEWRGEDNQPCYNLMHELLEQSYAYETVGSAQVDGLSARVPVSITVFDFSLLQPQLAERTTYLAGEPDADCDTEEGVMQLLYEALQQLTEGDPTVYYTTETIELSMIYSNGGWLVELDEEILSLLSGRC